jgi:hypothetical protein
MPGPRRVRCRRDLARLSGLLRPLVKPQDRVPFPVCRIAVQTPLSEFSAILNVVAG